MHRDQPIIGLEVPGAEVDELAPQPAQSTTDEMVDMPKEYAGVFDQSEELRTLFRIARSSGSNPYTLLVFALAHLSVAISPHVVLPPREGIGTPGAYGSLNLLIAVVGKSGADKGNTMSAVKQSVKIVDSAGMPLVIPEEHLGGSGEGLEAYYSLEKDENGVECPQHTTALWSLPEIGTLESTKQRKGGGRIIETLKQAWSGEQMGSVNASKETTRRVKAHSYRCAAITGVQPERSATLLEDNGGGFPQRFIWVRAEDPTAPEEPMPTLEELEDGTLERYSRDEWHETLTITVPPEFVSHSMESGFVTINRPQSVVKLLRAEKRKRSRGEATEQMDSHRRLSQLKVAALLSVMHGQEHITPFSWQIAEKVMEESYRNRAYCLSVLSQGREEQARESGVLMAARQDSARRKRLESRLMELIDAAGLEGVNWSAIQQRLNSQERELAQVLLKKFIEEGRVIETVGQRNSRSYTLPRS